MANAFVNLGASPYPLASQITTGNAQPWYNSSQIAGFFGGQQPNAQQISAFNSAVMQRVEQTFQLSGVSVNLTTDPSVAAAHTLSLVSNTTSNTNPGVIGMTQVGGSGFSFIDQQAKSAGSLDQLEWIAAHNISHELMLAFGVGEKYDQTGNFVDARNATWAMMTSPDSTFSQAAAQALTLAITSNSAVTTGLQCRPGDRCQACPRAHHRRLLARRPLRGIPRPAEGRLGQLSRSILVPHSASRKARLRGRFGRHAETEFLAGLEGASSSKFS